MKVVLQRTKKATVKVKEKVIGQIEEGLVILVGFTEHDNEEIIEKMIDKIINLRIFDGDKKLMNLSLLDVKGSILSISQFTLYADTKKGRRPSYINSLHYIEAEKLYKTFNQLLLKKNINVQTGIFGENMEVSLINDGPVTIIIEI